MARSAVIAPANLRPDESFKSWEEFLDAYYEPIRIAIGLMPFVGEESVDDVAQSFFLKLYERDILTNRPTITGRFRDWFYAAARNHALDEFRKTRRRTERGDAFEAWEPTDSSQAGPDEATIDADESNALSVLHLTVWKVREHLLAAGKPEHWKIFEELVIAPLIPGRVAKTREQLLTMYPGQGMHFLDNTITVVKRVFRRILPTLIPADRTDSSTQEERIGEVLEFLRRASTNNRLWTAFLMDPTPGPEASSSSPRELMERSTGAENVERIDPVLGDGELRERPSSSRS